jgi:1-deoxy-D-xylulose-5-phosphate synthase
MDIIPGPLLKTIDSPIDLKQLPREKLHQVCDELRQYIIDVVSVHGGHFGASLGVPRVDYTSLTNHFENDTKDSMRIVFSSPTTYSSTYVDGISSLDTAYSQLL